jgi:hypothetical protein
MFRSCSVVLWLHETRDIACMKCQVCRRGDELLRGWTTIGFEIHGSRCATAVGGAP